MKYDAIVIGAGNGGLVSALTLQKQGKNVLVLEAHNLPGGFATSFIRGRFEFEASLHELCGYGNEEVHGNVYELFKRLGILDKVSFQQVSESYHVVTLDTDEEYVMPYSVSDFIKKMEEYVPGSTESVEEFFELAKEVSEALDYFSTSKGNISEEVLQNDYPNFMKVASYSVDTVLDALNMPKKAQEILTVYWSYLGSPTNTLSFVHFSSMLYSYITNGAWVPLMRSHEISLVLEEEFEACGGTIRFLSSVNEILFENGKVSGVRTSDGSVYYANHLISNISPTKFYSLVPEEKVNKKAFQLCNARTLGVRGICVYLGLNRSMKELGLNHYTYFIYHTLDSNKEFKLMQEMYHDSMVAIALPDDNKGTTILELTSFYTSDVFSKNVTEENYFEVKEKIASVLIESFEKSTGLTIQDFIEEIEIATPVTFARYGGHPDGSIYGYMAKGYDNLMPRIMNEKNENYIENVYFCGGFASRLSGYSSSYLSGESAAFQTLKDLKKEESNGKD